MATAPAMTATAAALVEAARVMAAQGLVTAFGHISARVEGPGGPACLITPAADLLDVVEADLVTVSTADLLRARAAPILPQRAPRETWLHLAIYQRRPDVMAVARGQPLSTFVAGALAAELEPIHGQAAWLGRRVPVHPDAALVRSQPAGEAAATSLGEQQALVLRGNGAVAVGATAAEAVTRLWLLDTACRVWVQAKAAGRPAGLSDDEVAGWQAAAPPLLARLWDHLRRPPRTANTFPQPSTALH
jgi:HCOMODA/2-hydroxy-3-carboxy-muconic semialdehyde decarboxylase